MDWRKKLFLGITMFVLILILGLLCFSWKKNERIRFVKEMGNGINLGNSLDATNLREYKPDAGELEYETFWNNPRIDKEQLEAIYDAGFRTVRIPVTWEGHMDENFKISEVWMSRVAEVVDMALSEGLYVILDVHDGDWSNLQIDRKEEIHESLEKVWSQIAEKFKNYDEHLLFEGMNEPRLRDSEYEWNEGTAELREFVNDLNQTFTDTVRKSGGNNKERYLLVCPYCNGAWKDTVADLDVPDGNIIIAVHMYRPYNFCQNEEGTDEWDKSNLDDVSEAEESFALMNAAFIRKSVPVIFTEYGCIDKNNTKEREEWASFYMELSKKYEIPCIWWDNGSTYQLLDRETNEWVYPGIVDIISQ